MVGGRSCGSHRYLARPDAKPFGSYQKVGSHTKRAFTSPAPHSVRCLRPHHPRPSHRNMREVFSNRASPLSSMSLPTEPTSSQRPETVRPCLHGGDTQGEDTSEFQQSETNNLKPETRNSKPSNEIRFTRNGLSRRTVMSNATSPSPAYH